MKNKELPKHYTNEETGISYTLQGEYYIPDLAVREPTEEEKASLGHWGQKRQEYLKEHHHGVYMNMYLKGTLSKHLHEVDEMAFERMETLVKQMAKAEGLTENMKDTDMMKWVGLMNNIRSRAKEIVMNELIYN